VLILETKSGKPRRALLTNEGRAFFESITAGRPPHEPIFLHEGFDGRKWKEEKINRTWKQSEQQRPMGEACLAAGLPKMGFHQLRHSYASALVAAGMPLAYVAQLTGHADTRILEKHYAHLAPSDLSRSLEALAPKLGIPVVSVEVLKIRKEGA
jgi:integrase